MMSPLSHSVVPPSASCAGPGAHEVLPSILGWAASGLGILAVMAILSTIGTSMTTILCVLPIWLSCVWAWKTR